MKTIGTHNYFVYILTNLNKTVLYVGVTNNLERRLYEHSVLKSGSVFTSKYKCFYLIFYEYFIDSQTAILREKQIKGWKRSKKEALINLENSDWNFLNSQILGSDYL